MSELSDAIDYEIFRKARNSDEAAQPPEVIEVTYAELMDLRRERDASGPLITFGNGASEPPTYRGLEISLIEERDRSPIRVKSRAEVLLDQRQRRGPPTYFTVSTPR